MNDNELKNLINNIAITTDGLNFLEVLLDKLGAYDRGFNFQNHDMEIYNKAKREQGLWLLDLIMQSNFDKYTELQQRRKDKLCQKN